MLKPNLDIKNTVPSAEISNTTPVFQAIDFISALPYSTAAPGTVVNTASTDSEEWADLGNLAAKDLAYATNTMNATTVSDFIDCTNFGFNIPTEATITGVQLRINRRASSINSLADNLVKLIVSGSTAGNSNAPIDYWPNVNTDQTYGGANDLWANTLTPAIVNATNFGVRFQCANDAVGVRAAFLDYLTLTVFYTV